MDEIPDEVKVYHAKPRKIPKPKSLSKWIWKKIWKAREIMKVIYREKPDVLYSKLWYTKVATAFAGLLLRKKLCFQKIIV